jgi:hypothetical protein
MVYGELSEDQRHLTLPFEDVHRLVTTRRMAELILNDRVRNSRKAKLEQIKTQLSAEHCSNMFALLVKLEKAKHALTCRYSFESVGAFDAQTYDLEGMILFETMLITRAVDWLEEDYEGR